MERQSRYTRNDQIPWKVINGEAVLVDAEAGEVIHFNDTGTFLWEMCGTVVSEEELVIGMVEDFAVERPAAEEDVRSFVKGLLDRDLLVSA